jgi:hypothetical protein
MTETTSTWCSNMMLNRPLSCCRKIVIVVLAMKPIITTCDRKSVINFYLHEWAHGFENLELHSSAKLEMKKYSIWKERSCTIGECQSLSKISKKECGSKGKA